MKSSLEEQLPLKLLASFDFDHTLFEYQPPRHEVHADILQEQGFQVSANRILLEEFHLRTKPPPEYRVLIKQWPRARERDRLRIILQGMQILLQRLLPKLPKKKKEQLARVIEKTSKELLSYDPVPEVYSVLKELKDQEIPIIINSGNVLDIIKSHLELHGLLEYFDHIIAVDTHAPRKRENFQYMVEKSKKNGMRIVHVGDEPNTDYFAPKSCGVYSYLVVRSSLLQRYVRELYPNVLERDIFQDLKEYAKHVLNFANIPSLSQWDVINSY